MKALADLVTFIKVLIFTGLFGIILVGCGAGAATTSNSTDNISIPDGDPLSIQDNTVHFYYGRGIESVVADYITSKSTTATGSFVNHLGLNQSSMTFQTNLGAKSSRIADDFVKDISDGTMTANAGDSTPHELYFYITTNLRINGHPILNTSNESANFYIGEGRTFWGYHNWWVGSKYAQVFAEDSYGHNIMKVKTVEDSYYICPYGETDNTFYITDNSSDCRLTYPPIIPLNKVHFDYSNPAIDKIDIKYVDSISGDYHNKYAYSINNKQYTVIYPSILNESPSIANYFLQSTANGGILSGQLGKPSELYFLITAHLYINGVAVVDESDNIANFYIGENYNWGDGGHSWWIGSNAAVLSNVGSCQNLRIITNNNGSKEFYYIRTNSLSSSNNTYVIDTIKSCT